MRNRWIAPVFTAGLATAIALAVPGTAQASTYEAQSHSSVTVAYTVRAGDTAWRIAASRCGSGYAHTRLTIRSAAGLVRYDHDRIWPADRVTGPCTGASVPRRATQPTSSGWVSPLTSYRLTSCYAMRWGRWHYGIDMAAGSGTPIRAAAAGTILEAGWLHRGYGISVAIHHGNGVKTFYGHMIREIVSSGQRVRAGQTIGYVGSTGFSTGPHLHLGMHVGAGLFPLNTNPASFLRARGVRIGC